MDSYRPRQISQSDCEISSNCGKINISKMVYFSSYLHLLFFFMELRVGLLVFTKSAPADAILLGQKIPKNISRSFGMFGCENALCLKNKKKMFSGAFRARAVFGIFEKCTPPRSGQILKRIPVCVVVFEEKI